MHIKTDKRENYNERVFREDSEKYFGKDRIYCSDRCFESRKFLPTFRKGLSGCKGCSRNCSVPGIQFKSTLYRRCRLLENHERNQKHEMCQEFMEDMLNAFIEYDQKNESELLETLEVLVNNLGARNVTANALHLHRNTLSL